jgi:hypothetical protein
VNEPRCCRDRTLSTCPAKHGKIYGAIYSAPEQDDKQKYRRHLYSTIRNSFALFSSGLAGTAQNQARAVIP